MTAGSIIGVHFSQPALLALLRQKDQRFLLLPLFKHLRHFHIPVATCQRDATLFGFCKFLLIITLLSPDAWQRTFTNEKYKRERLLGGNIPTKIRAQLTVRCHHEQGSQSGTR